MHTQIHVLFYIISWKPESQKQFSIKIKCSTKGQAFGFLWTCQWRGLHDTSGYLGLLPVSQSWFVFCTNATWEVAVITQVIGFLLAINWIVLLTQLPICVFQPRSLWACGEWKKFMGNFFCVSVHLQESWIEK